MVSHQTGRRAVFPAATRSFLAMIFACALADEAFAQGSGCVLQAVGSPQRQILRCRDGLTIEAEAGAAFNLVDRNRDAVPDAVNLQNRAVLIDAPTGALRQGFQVQTPQAIAAVRGTQWVIDVSTGKTAVFAADLLPTAAHLPEVWVMGYDLFPLDTLNFKRAFLREAIDREYLILFEHDPDIAAGYIREKDGKRFIEPVA